MLGVDEGFVPPTPFARVPLYILIGAISDQPMAVNGELGDSAATHTHRHLGPPFRRWVSGRNDGARLKRWLSHPWELDGLEQAPWASMEGTEK